MEPEQVLDLIRSAPERYDTVRAALRYRGDGLVHKEIRKNIARSEAGRRAFEVSAREASEAIERPIDHPEPDGPFGGAAGPGTPTSTTGVWRQTCLAAG